VHGNAEALELAHQRLKERILPLLGIDDCDAVPREKKKEVKD